MKWPCVSRGELGQLWHFHISGVEQHRILERGLWVLPWLVIQFCPTRSRHLKLELNFHNWKTICSRFLGNQHFIIEQKVTQISREHNYLRIVRPCFFFTSANWSMFLHLTDEQVSKSELLAADHVFGHQTVFSSQKKAWSKLRHPIWRSRIGTVTKMALILPHLSSEIHTINIKALNIQA